MSKSIDNKVSNLVISKLVEFLGSDVSEAIALRIKEKYAIDINDEKMVIANPDLLEKAFMDLLGAVAAKLIDQINHDLINSFSKKQASDLHNIEEPKFSNYIKMMIETASTVDHEAITTTSKDEDEDEEKKDKKSVKPEEIFSILSDGPTIKILKSALIGFPADSFWMDINLTRKQYYDRLHKLRQIDLIRRRNNVYKVTALGQIIVHVILGTVEEIVTNYWELKALESFRYTVPPEERSKIINSMLSNTKIKEYLL